MDEEEKEEPTVSTKTTPSSSAPSHPHGHAEVLWYYQDPQGNVQGNLVSKFGQDNTTLFLYSSTVRGICQVLQENWFPTTELWLTKYLIGLGTEIILGFNLYL